MSRSSYKRVSDGEMKGWMREEIFYLLPPNFFKDPVSAVYEMHGKVLKESKVRWAAIFTVQNQQRIFLKMDRTKDWIESLKYVFLPSKGRKEWFVAHQLQKKKLNIPKPLGWMERIHRGFVQESYYLSEAFGSGVSLIDESVRLGDHFPLNELATTIKKFHDTGLFHKDLHAGNFLWDDRSLFLTDLHHSKILRNVSLRQRLWNLSLLFHSLRSVWGEKEQSRFMEAYFGGESFCIRRKEEYLQKVHLWMDRLQKRQRKSRTKRCLKESSEFSIEKEKGISYYSRRDFPREALKKVVEEHIRLRMEKPSALAKDSPSVTISVLEEGGRKLSVKDYRPVTIWDGFREHFRRSKGLKAWIAGNGLTVRGIPSLKPLGLMEKRNWLGLKESFFIMEVKGGDLELDRYILGGLGDYKERRIFVKVFAQWLSQYHQMELYHRDMKTCNILVSEEGKTWVFHLLDLEDVRLDTKVTERALFKNFVQLNTSTPKIITTTDRFRFLREYLSRNPVVRNQRIFLRHLIDESKRGGLVYVAPWGVVTEKL
jgi:tRNA A-37 threonylcarbamoyl transferase component Bud32